MRNDLYILAFVALVSAVLYRRIRIKRLPLPPGPPPRFLTGNLHQLPSNEPWLAYAEWAKQYGPLVCFRLFRQRYIVLNSGRAAMDLLDARSGIYSDRPDEWMLGRLAGQHSTMFVLSSADARFPKYRKMLQSGMSRRATQAYRPTQEHQLKTLLRRLSETPEAFLTLTETYVASIALRIAYGYDVAPDNDYFINLIQQSGREINALVQPYFYVEAFPLLRFVPSWFSFVYFKRAYLKSRKVFDAVETGPFKWAEAQIESGRYTESFFSQYLRPEDGHDLDAVERDTLKWTAAAIYAGGARTTTSAITSFFLLMSLHPAIQKSAQAEIERVLGRGRLVRLEDQKALPYITAVLKEVLRWAPVAPLGLKHRVTKDDFYGGYLIPEGTTLIANIWAITHDSELYPSPSVFDPTRHLGETPQPDPFNFVFGYGRRVCPGATLAEETLFLAIANILAAFDIHKARDAAGHDIEPDIKWRTAVVTFATNFGCRIVPRAPDMLASFAV